MAQALIETSNFRQTLTSDGTAGGTVVGSVNGSVDQANGSINISYVTVKGATFPDVSVIQAQVTDYFSQLRAKAAAAGLTQFGEATQ